MKVTRFPILLGVLASSLALKTLSPAITVVVSGTNNQPVLDFLNANFSNITTIKSADYSDFINVPALKADVDSADVVIIGRILSSPAYDNATRSAAFNGLTVPLVSLTSYVTRTAGARFSWESGGVNTTTPLSGSETTLTAAGAALFGGAAGQMVDWFDGTANFNAAGTGTVGTGEILATLGGNILAAHWAAGATSAGGVTFPADRLLFNMQDVGGLVLPNSAGRQALVTSLDAYTPLTAVPEPSSTGIALASLGLLAVRRRR